VEAKSFALVRAGHIWLVVTAVLRMAGIAAAAVAVFVFLQVTLAEFPWTRAFAHDLVLLVLDPVRTLARGVVDSLPGLAFIVILALAVKYLIKLIRLFFDGVGAGRITIEGFDSDWAAPTYKLVRLVVLALAAVAAYPYVPGSDTAAFKGISVFAGIVLSLGSSSIIGNTLAGYTLAYRRTFRVGDWVKIGEHVGEVERIRLLVTYLRTFRNEELVVPNSMILSSEVLNYSTRARTDGLLLHTTVGIGYETPWRQVEAMLLEAASRVPGLLTSPSPFVLQTGLGDFCVNYELNVYCSNPYEMFPLYTTLHKQILDVFNEYGVQIMTPAYMGDPQQPKVVRPADWYAAPAKAPVAES
jgi:small-conductance mechanosensitive channel